MEDGGEELDIRDGCGVVPLVLDDVGKVVLVNEEVKDETFLPEDGADSEDLTIRGYLETIPVDPCLLHLGLQVWVCQSKHDGAGM